MKTIIAHRGAPTAAHENTIESFMRACESGADIIEFDVRRTKDNVLVAHHDPFIFHDSTKIDLGDLTFAELNVIASKHHFQVPEIRRIIRSFYGITGFDIELKEENCEQEVLDMISELPLTPNYFFTSFNLDILRKLKKTDSSLQTGLLFESMDAIRGENCNALDYLCPDYSTLFSNRDFFSTPAFSRFSFYVWTINTSEELRKAFEDPLIDAVITNETAVAVKIRGENHKSEI